MFAPEQQQQKQQQLKTYQPCLMGRKHASPGFMESEGVSAAVPTSPKFRKLSNFCFDKRVLEQFVQWVTTMLPRCVGRLQFAIAKSQRQKHRSRRLFAYCTEGTKQVGNDWGQACGVKYSESLARGSSIQRRLTWQQTSYAR